MASLYLLARPESGFGAQMQSRDFGYYECSVGSVATTVPRGRFILRMA